MAEAGLNSTGSPSNGPGSQPEKDAWNEEEVEHYQKGPAVLP